MRRAQTLAEEIRHEESSNEVMLRLADDLDELTQALEFALEFVEQTGHGVVNIEIATLTDALDQLAKDATIVSEQLDGYRSQSGDN
jgi:hypothetical protein